MTECFMCGKSLELGSNDRGGHDVCFEEQLSRTDVYRCVGCDENEPENDDTWCFQCNTNDNIYQNYPGPQ